MRHFWLTGDWRGKTWGRFCKSNTWLIGENCTIRFCGRLLDWTYMNTKPKGKMISNYMLKAAVAVNESEADYKIIPWLIEVSKVALINHNWFIIGRAMQHHVLWKPKISSCQLSNMREKWSKVILKPKNLSPSSHWHDLEPLCLF